MENFNTFKFICQVFSFNPQVSSRAEKKREKDRKSFSHKGAMVALALG
jgi:hypothetical protein